jgi:hypothetical protein
METIDFSSEVEKRDKLNKLCDFCLEFVPDNLEVLFQQVLKYPGFFGMTRYTDEDRNQIVTIRIFPKRNNCVRLDLHSKSLDTPPIYNSLFADIDVNRNLVFLLGNEGKIMRNAEGKLFEMIGWIDMETNTAKTLPEILPNTRKNLEEAYDRFYTEDTPKVLFPDLRTGLVELRNVIKSTIDNSKRAERKEKLRLIKPGEASLVDS